MLSPLLFGVSGCDLKNTPRDICIEFLNNLRIGEYAKAYEMLHGSVKLSEEQLEGYLSQDKSQPQQTITQQQFITRYASIFKELQITDFMFDITSETEGEVISVFEYALYYDSALLAEEFNFRLSMLLEEGKWRIEWGPSLIFPEMQWGDTIRVAKETARRGEIISDGVTYASTVNAISVLAVIDKIEDTFHFSRQLSPIIDIPADTIEKRIENATTQSIVLKQFYPDEFTSAIEAQLLLITGVSVDKSNFGTLRYYPFSEMLSHIIGYTGSVTQEELLELTGDIKGDDRYNIDSKIGKTGLEAAYENQLRGHDGYFVYICTQTGENRQTLYRKPAEDGFDLQLTLNAELQDKAHKLLSYALYGDQTAGVVIVMEPTTGKILAMDANPSFDLNMFTRGLSESQWKQITGQPNAPLFDRLTQGRYPPGSIIKPFTAAAALESGAMTVETEFPFDKERIDEKLYWTPSDTGEFGPWRYSKITRITLNNRHTPLNMHNGMIDSDNIYFAYSALRIGASYYEQFCESLGLNEAIPFDIKVNTAQVKNKDSEMNPMLLAESAFGQGELLTTPLQAALLFSAFANSGNIMRPYIVDGLYKVTGISYSEQAKTAPEIWRGNVVTGSSIDAIVPMLVDVVKRGTGYQLKMDDIAAKTGTAQLGDDRKREISWFVGFRVNSEEPRLVLVMLEIPANEHELSATRFHIARSLFQTE